MIRAVPAPESLAAVLYDPSAPIKVGNMDDWYSLQDSACAVRQTARQLEQTLRQHLQLARKIFSDVTPLSDGTQQSIRRGSRVVRYSCTLTSEWPLLNFGQWKIQN